MVTNQDKSTAGKKPLLSLIIAVYNHPEFLSHIFCSLENQTFKTFEILVADDGSGEEISRVINNFRSILHQPIHHIWHEDQGFRKARIANKAVLASKGDYLVFIDGDSILHHRFLERHYKKRGKRVALAGRRVRLSRQISESLNCEAIRNRQLEKLRFWWFRCAKNSRKHGVYAPIVTWSKNLFYRDFHIRGCNFSLHKEDFLAVNGYDESIIGRGLEDDNLCARLKLAGIVVKSVAQSAIQYHQFHEFDPVPHSEAEIQRYFYPKDFWAENGIEKTP
jgi:glycosyltransferase involved in cell wall biosynthesis